MLDADDIKGVVAELVEFGTDTQTVEVKRSRNDVPKHLWHGLSAFANTPRLVGPGLILLGVDEGSGFAITGVTDVTRVQDAVAGQCALLDPVLRPRIYPVDVDGATVIVVEVDELPYEQKPCVHAKKRSGFRRVSDGNRVLEGFELLQLQAARKRAVDDEAPMEGVGLGALDPTLVEWYVEHARTRNGGRFDASSDEEVLMARGVMADEKTVSLAGLVAFGVDPTDFRPALNVEFIVFPYNEAGRALSDGTRFIDNRKISGPIPYIYRQLISYLIRHLSHGGRIDTHRTDVPEYPDVVLREAILNALVHRDYHEQWQNSPVTVHVFPNRIEISNPGGLYQVSLDDLGRPSGRSTRNARLMSILEDTPTEPGSQSMVVDNRGTGIPTIVRALKDAGLHQPSFENSIANFRITIPRGSLFTQAELEWIGAACPTTLSAEQRIGAALLYRGEHLTNERYRAETGSDSRDAHKDLQSLVDAGIAVFQGGGRGSHYVLDPRQHERENHHDGNDDGNSKDADGIPIVRPVFTKAERHLELTKILAAKPDAIATDLARDFNVSKPTVERDIRELRERGLVPSSRRRGRPKSRDIPLFEEE